MYTYNEQHFPEGGLAFTEAFSPAFPLFFFFLSHGDRDLFFSVLRREKSVPINFRNPFDYPGTIGKSTSGPLIREQCSNNPLSLDPVSKHINLCNVSHY